MITFPTADELVRMQEELDAFFSEPVEPTVEDVLARWQSASAAAFMVEDAVRKAAEAAPVAKPAAAKNVITIATARMSADYKVIPFATSWGRGFNIEKINAKKPECYSVLIGATGEADRCDCGAATFSSHKPCKHVTALKKLIANGMRIPAAKPRTITNPAFAAACI
jgi:hypothetical protein